MKEPIKPSEMKVGDLIRWEGDGDFATEFRMGDADLYVPRENGAYYLLDRPKPAVELPTEPTLGWAEWTPEWGRRLGVWRRSGDSRIEPTSTPTHTEHGTTRDALLSFTPAVAVPKEALDELREATADSSPYKNPLRTFEAISRFLAAVDEANR